MAKKAKRKYFRRIMPSDASPADRADNTIHQYRKGKFRKAELYDRLQMAGLSPEEANEMCNLEEQADG